MLSPMISSLDKPKLGSVIAIGLALFLKSACAQAGKTYVLDSEWAGANFFDGWDFFTGSDPTGGLVTYYDQQSAQGAGLIRASSSNPTYIGADYTNTIAHYDNGEYGAGRPSVRIATQKRFTHGLFIADIAHAPGGICGTWPAWWTLGDNWPSNGEIDIMEGVNQLSQNAMSLHSSTNCSIAGDMRTESGTLQGADCTYYMDTGANGQGCGVADTRSTSYGTGFNSIGGGVYAMQWTSDYIRVWFFPRNSIPSDITSQVPSPSSWGLPAADLQGACNIDQHFQGHKIIFDNTFCGGYAGVESVWDSQTESCAASTGYSTCNAFVAANPQVFDNAYWSINSVRVYQLQDGSNSNVTPYIASLQPTATVSAMASSSSVPMPLSAYCPSYDFSVISDSHGMRYQIECSYDLMGPDLGPPYSGYVGNTFETCIGGCTTWNRDKGSNYCVMVSFNTQTNVCSWKHGVTGVVLDSNYNSARLIYYGYPRIIDDPRAATVSSASTAYVSTSVRPQTYEDQLASSATLSLTSASAASSVLGLGMGGSVSLLSSSATTDLPLSTTSTVSRSYSSEQTSATTELPLSITRPFLPSSSSEQASPLSSFVGISYMTSTPLSTPTSSASPVVSLSQISDSPSVSATPATPVVSTASSLQTGDSTVNPTAASSHNPPDSFATTPTSLVAPPPSSSATILPVTTTFVLVTVPPTSIPSTASSTAQPPVVGTFRYVGCLRSGSGSSAFRLAESSTLMSIEQCIPNCYESAYAALYDTDCYCGDGVDATAELEAVPDGQCNTPCPGDTTEMCGGRVANAMLVRRQQNTFGDGVLLTVYKNGSIEIVNGISLIAGDTPSTPVVVGEVDPVTTPWTSPSGLPSGIPVIVSTVWVDVCSECIGGTTQLATTVTMIHCGCTQSTDLDGSVVAVQPPTVPMTTTVKQGGNRDNGVLSNTTIVVPCFSGVAGAAVSVAAWLSSWSASPGASAPTPIPWQGSTMAAVTGRPTATFPSLSPATTATVSASAAMMYASEQALVLSVPSNATGHMIIGSSVSNTQTLGLQAYGNATVITAPAKIVLSASAALGNGSPYATVGAFRVSPFTGGGGRFNAGLDLVLGNVLVLSLTVFVMSLL